MSTKLTRSVKSKSRSLKSTSTSVYWSLLAQLYRAHKSNLSLEPLARIIRERNFDQALDLADTWSAQKYPTAWEHYMYNQFANLIKKQPLPSRFNPEARALEAFLRNEADLAALNRRFGSWCIDVDFGVSATRQRYNTLFRRMRSFIAYVLGDEVPLMSVLEKVGFGPGASIGVSGNATNAMRKLVAMEAPTVTPRAFTLFAAAVSQNLWLRRVISPDPDGHEQSTHAFWVKALYAKCDFVRYNKICFAPKTAKIHRTIAVEPLGNSILQKGADLVMRARLLRVGLDLSDQTVNQQFALAGSKLDVSDPIATIDLRNASDRGALNLVKLLFPASWFELLNSLRCEYFLLDGKEHRYQKFSSMGNGTTFPIETLLFAAACHAVGCGTPGKDFAVYGDDIAVPASKAKVLLKLLRVMGFAANGSKTFFEGPFRESCGEDWFGGASVRPLVLDYALDSVGNVFKFLNQSKGRTLWVDFFQPVRDYVLRLLPLELQFFRPFTGSVDTGIDGTIDECMTSHHCSFKKNVGWTWQELAVTPVEDHYYLPWRGHTEPPDYVKWYGVHTLRSAAHVLSHATKRHQPEFPSWFTLRRVVRAKVVRKHGSGAASNWLPGPGHGVMVRGMRD